MTREQAKAMSERLRYLERENLLPAATIRDLKDWWYEHLREEGIIGRKVLPFPTKEIKAC